ncbi:MAG: urease accessory protein UreH domain-containing protein, partial [Gammaproteobacteria bacterium]
MEIRTYRLAITDMQCVDCENNIEEAVLPLPGIRKAKADFASESLEIEYDNDAIALKTICAAVRSAGYTCVKYRSRSPVGLLKRAAYILFALAGILLLLQLENHVDFGLSAGEIDRNFGYGLLFLVGVLTSFHCIGMCGGFVISYTAGCARRGLPPHLSHLAYGFGKTLSYTFFGAVFGLAGEGINFTLGLRSLVSGLAGAFLIIYGLSMLDAFAGLRRFHIRLPRPFALAIGHMRSKVDNPLAIGLLNGLMFACGPLQAMYILAAGTGSWLEGAKILFVFALGTLPVMLLFGYMAG